VRGGDLYLAQAGAGQAILIRPGQVSRLGSDEAADRPLGQSLTPFLRFQHLEAQSGDVVLLTPHAGPQWADPTLAGILTLDLAQAVERLGAASSNDLTGLLSASRSPAWVRLPRAAQMPPHAGAPRRPGAPERTFAGMASVPRLRPRWWQAVQSAFRSPGQRMVRCWRGWPRPGGPGQPGLPFRPGGDGHRAPVVVAILASVICPGAAEQFQEYLGQAQAAVVAAQLQADPLQARFYWDQARQYLDQAQRYGEGTDYGLLRTLVDESLDTIDNIAHVEYKALFSGGFGRGARLTSMAATASDLYVLRRRPTIYHAWNTAADEIDMTSAAQGQRKC
jgi:hypothetical protein